MATGPSFPNHHVTEHRIATPGNGYAIKPKTVIASGEFGIPEPEPDVMVPTPSEPVLSPEPVASPELTPTPLAEPEMTTTPPAGRRGKKNRAPDKNAETGVEPLADNVTSQSQE